MRDDAGRKKLLKRRLRFEQLHLRFLQHLAVEPETADAEIDRRLGIIDSLRHAIRDHKAAIDRLQDQRDNVHFEIEKSERRRNHYLKELDKLLIEMYLEEYRAINKKIGELDARSNTQVT